MNSNSENKKFIYIIKQYITTFILLLPVITVSACSFNYSGSITPVAKKGVIDLRNWNFEKDGPIDLTGEWEFYWKKFLNAEDFTGENKPEMSGFIRVPGKWNNFKVNGKKISGDGYATYRLIVLMKQQNDFMAFKLNKMYTAYELYINGKRISSTGVVGTTPDTTVPRYFPHAANFISENNRMEVILHFSNFHHRKGGAGNVIRFGREKEILKDWNNDLSFDIFLLGSILIMGLYHFGLFLLRRNDKSTLYFGILCIVFVVRVLTTNEMYMIHFFPNIGFELAGKIEYFSYQLIVPIFVMFLYSLYPEEFTKLFLKITIAVSIPFYFIILFTPIKFFSYTNHLFIIFAFSVIIYSIFLLIISLIRKREGVGVVLLGFFVLFLTAINDMLFNNLIIQTMYLLPFGLLIFIFSQAFLISLRFSKAFFAVENLSIELRASKDEVDELNLNLELKVEQRTEELQATMEEMEAINDQLIVTRDALWGEMQLAKKIQTVLLPENPAISGYEISAYMAPADDVGGDYYDIINAGGTDWVVIGDVSGHGVSAGLIMMMVQTSINVSVSQNPDLHPSELLSIINKTITKNVKQMEEDKYMTITIMAAHKNGQFIFSGHHQDIMIYRAGTGNVELVETKGMWIGILDDIKETLEDEILTLDIGDTMLIYTDGITEAWKKGSTKEDRDPKDEMFGDKRLIEILKGLGDHSTDEINKGITNELDNYNCIDDVTMVVIKRLK